MLGARRLVEKLPKSETAWILDAGSRTQTYPRESSVKTRDGVSDCCFPPTEAQTHL